MIIFFPTKARGEHVYYKQRVFQLNNRNSEVFRLEKTILDGYIKRRRIIYFTVDTTFFMSTDIPINDGLITNCTVTVAILENNNIGYLQFG